MSATYYETFDQAYTDALNAIAGGKREDTVIRELIEKGVPAHIALQIVTRAKATKKAAFRQAGFKVFLAGIAMLVLGVLVTGVTYSMAKPGGTYVVTFGLFAVGAINALKGLFRMLVG